MGYVGSIKKYSEYYLAKLTPPEKLISDLDTDNYEQLRQVETFNFSFNELEQTLNIFSKPGVFGWKKNDEGTILLLNEVLKHFENTPSLPEKMLDLGCGSGIIVATAKKIGIKHCYATDNNASAILATEKTLEENNLLGTVFPSDCTHIIDGETNEKVDLVLCNPPFHQGIDIKNSLTEKFVMNTEKTLNKEGYVFFVTNAFVGIEKYIQHYFNYHKQLVNNNKFKVIMAKK